MKSWSRHFFQRKEVLKTTWKLRLGVLLGLGLLGFMTAPYWLPLIGDSLVCHDVAAPSDLIIVENLDADYLVFERAHQLLVDGFGESLLVPVQATGDGSRMNFVSRRFVEVMCEVAGIDAPEMIAVREDEPISLTVASQVREALKGRSIRSVIVVAPLFRSMRTRLVYQEVLRPLGIEVYGVPAESIKSPQNWWKTWHGVQQVTLEFVKLWYYRLFVLRGRS